MSLRLSGGRRLQSPQGSLARPTPARVRLAVMNILGAELQGCRWLDLCAGSGAMACEALQRGAGVVLAVDQDRRLAALARANLEAVQRGLQHPCQVEVHAGDVVRWLRKGRGQQPAFDLIYADPPYAAGLYAPIAAAVLAGGWLRPEGTLIWECASADVPESPAGWLLRDRRRYGTTTLLLLQQQEQKNSAVQQGTAAVLVPGRHEQPQQGDGDQTEHDAAEQRFDHGRA
ncbi:16S rRNA (guanine(966)-N(2))-methyltransferase RsmD [Cyanobium sp. CH-040]|nr:16S rRNA (guanine(966)-N(2))-methyltransferase RsmD [Cyanobium sp. CH-040]